MLHLLNLFRFISYPNGFSENVSSCGLCNWKFWCCVVENVADDHLLRLKAFGGIPMVRLADFLRMVPSE